MTKAEKRLYDINFNYGPDRKEYERWHVSVHIDAGLITNCFPTLDECQKWVTGLGIDVKSMEKQR
jgi:hypothetical protein